MALLACLSSAQLASGPQPDTEFACWLSFRMKGRGRCRMAADLEDAVITKRLVEFMEEAAGIIGVPV